MNSESPFRTSNLVLTFACVFCGIIAAFVLIPRFELFARPVARSAVVFDLQQQQGFSEFQTNEGNSFVDSRQLEVAPRPLRLPESGTGKSTSIPVVHSGTRASSPERVRQSTSAVSHRCCVESTSVERSVSQHSAKENPIRQFYAPVTVHPVTVNIDNSGIVREISRVHERLDLLCSEVRLAEQIQQIHPTPPALEMQPAPPAKEIQEKQEIHQDTVPGVPLPEPGVHKTARRFEYIVHDDQSRKSSISKQADQIQTQDPVAAAVVETENVPKPKPVPTRISTRPEKRKSASLPVKTPRLQHETTAVDAEVMLNAPIAPLAVTPGPMMPLPLPEPPQEFNMEIIPQQPIPDNPRSVPQSVEPQSEEPEILPVLEFSTELLSIPDPASGFDMTSENEPRPETVPSTVSAEIERTAFCAPVVPYDRPALQKPDGKRVVFSGATKRTTDPPFRHDERQQGTALSTRIARVKPVQQELASHARQSMELRRAHPDCRSCGFGHQTHTPNYRIQAVTSSQTPKRMSSINW